MTSVATGIGVIVAVGLNVASVFVHQNPAPLSRPTDPQATAKPAEPEITMTGCLVMGSAPTVFVLQNAKRDPQSTTEKGARYLVVPATEDLFLKEHLNHQVRILGTPDGRPQPTPAAGRPADEKDLPRLNAKGLTMVTNACGTGGGYSAAAFFEMSGVLAAAMSPADRSLFASESHPDLVGMGFTHAAFATGAGPSHGSDDGQTFPQFSTLASQPGMDALLHWVSASSTDDDNNPEPGDFSAERAPAPPLMHPDPSTLLLIASGLLLVVYAGRRDEWHAFRRRSVR